ncbi:PHP domain-containing protein [Candidatus Pacearchaeota archaeon]|nr:PHP domain-containing protein [Candidatus Pacearchaeota archaeon]
MIKIDLHMHSNHSDGDFSPKELVELVSKKSISAMAITDHDKATANKEAEEYAKEKGIEYVHGIEITATPPEGVKELHIIGLFIDSKNEEIKNISDRHKKYAIDTAKKIIEKLNKLGYEISFEELVDETKGDHFGRPFIANILMKKYPEKFQERNQVFDALLGKQGKAFVLPRGTELEEVIKIIHGAGGIAIVAHPWYLGENMEKILEEFVSLGGDGIELDYSPKDAILENTKDILKGFAKKNNLIISGGTDFHKLEKEKKEIGDEGISEEEFLKLKEYHQKNEKI